MAATFNQNKIFSMIRKISLAAPALAQATRTDLDNRQKVIRTLAEYTGYNLDSRDFRFDRLVRGWGPYISATVITKVAPKIGSFIKSLF